MPDLFVGYSKEFSKISSNIEGGNKFSLLIGPTGSGKTTFLKHIVDQYSSHNSHIMYVSKPPKDPMDWLTVFNKFTRKGILGSLLSRKEDVNLYTLSTHVNKKLGDRKCILLIDECHEASLDSLEWLRTLADHVDNLSIILAGLPIFETILKNNLETFRRRINSVVELTNLTKSETRELIKRRIEKSGGEDIKPFTHEAIELIYERTAGFPREVIRACYEFVEKAAEKNTTTIDIDFLGEMEEPIKRVSIETISTLPERQRSILEILSQNGEMTPSEIIPKMNVKDYKNRENAVRSVNNLLKRLMRDKFAERVRVGKTYKYKVSKKFQTLMVEA
ncbi:MAG: AAA family ATPase [Nanoarchaeota archaeon]